MASEIQLEPQINNEMDLRDQQIYNQISKIGFIDSISFKLQGYIKVGCIKRGEHYLDAYLFKCDVHGLQVTTPSGHYELLLCPTCIREREAEKKSKDVEPIASSIESAKTLNKYLNKNIGRENK
jgi:hypothetical protein